MITTSIMSACYATPSTSGHEQAMIGFVTAILSTMPGVSFKVDRCGNVLVTKGALSAGQAYPLLVAHTDTVQRLARIQVLFDGEHFYGRCPATGKSAGIGADDKAGVLLALELLSAVPVAKAAFFTMEETGYHGATAAGSDDPAFFADVGYALEFDCPGRRTVAATCGGVPLFGNDSALWDTARPVLAQYDRTELQHHPYTDLCGLRRLFSFEALNVAVGYYHAHSSHEFVRLTDWFEARDCGLALMLALGGCRYTFSGVAYAGQVGRMAIDQPRSWPPQGDSKAACVNQSSS